MLGQYISDCIFVLGQDISDCVFFPSKNMSCTNYLVGFQTQAWSLSFQANLKYYYRTVGYHQSICVTLKVILPCWWLILNFSFLTPMFLVNFFMSDFFFIILFQFLLEYNCNIFPFHSCIQTLPQTSGFLSNSWPLFFIIIAFTYVYKCI